MKRIINILIGLATTLGAVSLVFVFIINPFIRQTLGILTMPIEDDNLDERVTFGYVVKTVFKYLLYGSLACCYLFFFGSFIILLVHIIIDNVIIPMLNSMLRFF